MADPKKFVDHPLVPTFPLPPTVWWIKGIIPRSHSAEEIFITVLYGLPSTFKTYVLVSWAICIALGREWFGRKVKKGNVLYIAADDPSGPQPRGQAWAAFFELSPEQLAHLEKTGRLIKLPVNLFKDEEVNAFIEWSKERDFRPDVIIFDTYFHSSVGAKIATSEEDNLKVVGNARRLAAEVGAKGVIFSDHTPKDGKSLFGSVTKMASFDVLWEAVREGRTLAGNLINTRMRNAPISPDLTIKFEEVDLKTLPDEEGQTISPQLVLADVEEAKPEEKEDKKARFNEIFMEAVHVIAENWWVDDIIPSRNKFHEMTESKLKKQTGNDKGFSRSTFTAVLDDLVSRGILRRTGTGTGARYQVVLIPQGLKAKGPQKAAEAAPSTGTSSPI